VGANVESETDRQRERESVYREEHVERRREKERGQRRER